jgi:3-dehydroquinate synthase class II
MTQFRKVRAGAVYRYVPVMMDTTSPACHAEPGQIVRVVNLHGAPKANTMGHAHIEDAATGKFLGLCVTNSLTRESL